MSLSSELISQFVEVTKSDVEEKNETTVFGTIVVQNDEKFVQLDGSDLLTPISSTADVEHNERVTVLIKDHSAIVTGNISSPSARTDTVKDLSTEIGNKITEVEILIADKVSTKQFDAEVGRIDTLVTDNVTIKKNLEATNASVETLSAEVAEIEELKVDKAEVDDLVATKVEAEIADFGFVEAKDLEATNARVYQLESTYVSATELEAERAEIDEVISKKISAEDIEGKYANIDFSNIGEAAMRKVYVDSGLIKDATISEGTITGELVGVTIKGDIIQGGTVMADKLVIKGEDGLYYKLNADAGVISSAEVTEEQLQNGLHGSVIIAKSIAAEKISVDDLVAFGAKIAGFSIKDNRLYSGVKERIDNTTRGVYLDSEGQINIGDSDNFIKYYLSDEGTYRLEISAEEFEISVAQSAVDTMSERVEGIEGSVNDLKGDLDDKTSKESISTTIGLSDYSTKSELGDLEKTVNDNKEELNGKIEAIDSNIKTHFIFGDALVISKDQSESSISIDDDSIDIMHKGKQVQTFDSEGNAVIPNLKNESISVSKSFKLFGYEIVEDDAGNVNWTYVGGVK